MAAAKAFPRPAPPPSVGSAATQPARASTPPSGVPAADAAPPTSTSAAAAAVPAVAASVSGRTDSKPRALLWLPDGAVVCGAEDGALRVWPSAAALAAAPARTVKAHARDVQALAACPGGGFVSGAWDGRVRAWTAAVEPSGAATAEAARTPGAVAAPRVWAVACLADGRVAVGSESATVHMWARDGDAWRADGGLDGHGLGVNALAAWGGAAAPCLASGSTDKTIRLWRVRERACDAVLGPLGGRVLALAALRDGRELAAAGDEHVIHVWDVPTRAVRGVLRGHTYGVYALAALPGHRLLSAAGDGAVRLWDARALAPIALLGSHAMAVGALAVAPDASAAVSAGWDRSLRVWPLPAAAPDSAIQVAELTSVSEASAAPTSGSAAGAIASSPLPVAPAAPAAPAGAMAPATAVAAATPIGDGLTIDARLQALEAEVRRLALRVDDESARSARLEAELRRLQTR